MTTLGRNLLRRDPTRTTLIRERFTVELNRRFRRLKAKVRDFLIDADALALKEKKNPFTIFNAQPREYEFRTDAGKLAAFNEWFHQQAEAEILSPSEKTPPGSPWTATYVESSYKMGLLNAYLASKKNLLLDDQIGDIAKEEFLRQAFAAAESMSKVQLLATRSYESLRGITGPMAAEMNRILAQAIVDGKGVYEIAREMSERIEISLSRARTIARTEIIYAHAEGQLDAFERLGIDELGVEAEWSTAGDDRVCSQCASYEGMTFTVDEARGMIPLHPNCRCAWIPSA